MKLILILTICLYQNCWASIQLSKTAGQSSFVAIGNPSAIRIEGHGDAPEGELNTVDQGTHLQLSGELKLNLKSYHTGIDMRDRHMKEKYFEVDKFETATFKIENLKIDKAILKNEKVTQLPFSGSLLFHGVSRPIQGLLSVQKKEQLIVSTQFQIKISDFNLAIPSFAGIKVADTVEVQTLNTINSL